MRKGWHRSSRRASPSDNRLHGEILQRTRISTAPVKSKIPVAPGNTFESVALDKSLSDTRFRVYGSKFMVQGLGFRVHDSGFRVQDS